MTFSETSAFWSAFGILFHLSSFMKKPNEELYIPPGNTVACCSTVSSLNETMTCEMPSEDVEVSVEMRPAYTGAWLPLVGQLTSIAFDFADGRAQRDDVRYNPATSTALVVGGLGPDDDYTFTASVPASKLAKNSRAYAVDEPLQPAGQRLDEFLEPYVRSGRDPLTQVLLLARYLQKLIEKRNKFLVAPALDPRQ